MLGVMFQHSYYLSVIFVSVLFAECYTPIPTHLSHRTAGEQAV